MIHLHTQPSDPDLVDSLLHPQAVLIRRLLTRSKDNHGFIVIDDEDNILQAIRAGVVVHSVFHSNDTALSQRLLCRLPAAVRTCEIAKRTCKKLFENEKLSRVFAIANTPPAESLVTLLATRRDIVVLENIAISGNIGAIIRTSLALGVGGIVSLNAEPMDGFDRRVIRASRGYVFSLPLIAATADELIRCCARHARHLVVTCPGAGSPASSISSLPNPLAIVFGGEKRGCSQSLLDAAARRIEIPMSCGVESLNVAAAAAITLYCRYDFNSSLQ